MLHSNEYDSQRSSEVIEHTTLPAGGAWSHVMEPGQVVRIVDLEGRQAADFLCYNADRPEERYHAANTLWAAHTLRLTKGHTLMSDEARVMFTVIEDTYGYNDTIGGCCSTATNEWLYGVKGFTGCRENFINLLEQHGMSRRDLVPNINLFTNVPVAADGGLKKWIFSDPGSKPGEFVELQAEIKALALISNCPQANRHSLTPSGIEIVVWESEGGEEEK